MHPIVNLTTVLNNAMPLNPKQWVGEFPDYVDPNWTMKSTVPPATAPVCWVEKIGEHMAFERSLRAAA